jgi:hypothetical protein
MAEIASAPSAAPSSRLHQPFPALWLPCTISNTCPRPHASPHFVRDVKESAGCRDDPEKNHGFAADGRSLRIRGGDSSPGSTRDASMAITWRICRELIKIWLLHQCCQISARLIEPI